MGVHPLLGSLSRRVLNPIKTTKCIQRTSAGWPAQLTVIAFNRQCQYVSSSGYRAYCHAALADFFPDNSPRTIASTYLRLPTEGWPGWVDLGVWLDRYKFFVSGILIPAAVTHPSTNPGRRRATTLMWPTPLNTPNLSDVAKNQYRNFSWFF